MKPPSSFGETVLPVLVTIGSLALGGVLHTSGVIPSVTKELLAAFIGVFVCWVIAVLATPRNEGRDGRG